MANSLPPPVTPSPRHPVTARRPPGIIPEVYAKHLEEFQFLWGQRQAALRSPDFTLRDVGLLERRLAAHRDGLLLAGEAAIPVLEAGLTGDDPTAVFAAAYVLLALRTQAAAERVMGAFLQAGAEKLEAFRQALCHGPIDLIERPLREAAASARRRLPWRPWRHWRSTAGQTPRWIGWWSSSRMRIPRSAVPPGASWQSRIRPPPGVEGQVDGNRGTSDYSPHLKTSDVT